MFDQKNIVSKIYFILEKMRLLFFIFFFIENRIVLERNVLDKV